ncbi:GNAT family N-acetyltransferase [Photobacterium phosphoreum]|uniref:GNAT family N-acetyltransferase n=1 Tax=Photobacterium phosphoreum TaxID=659 RepID=UPI000D180CBA|nr:GNAT family N-acetyltransferase [Photobacterium phosphoreum]MCD9509038.1 GNAT family N-acetyltransferase [Photobacterium phosphoreum]PSU83028.1 GNAT family N-acetyltransferase [Photobacterium phosphoreum]
MSQVHYQQLNPIRLPIVNKLYKDFYPAGKAKRDETLWIGESQQKIICCVRFKHIGELQLLTGMLVTPEYRGQKIATQLLQHAIPQMQQKACYCFAFKELEALYKYAGFITLQPQQLPLDLQQRFERYCNSGKKLIPMHYNAQP